MVSPMPKPQFVIKSETLWLCERLEIARFMSAYAEHLQRQGVKLPAYQIVNFHSTDKLPALARQLSNFASAGKVRSVIFFVDAAQNLDARRNCLEAVRGGVYFSKIPYCAHFFFPGRLQGKRWRSGYLEDMLWKALRPETAASGDFINLRNVSQEYVDSVSVCRGSENKLSNRSRYVLYSYLAATEKYAGMNLGEAARAGAFALDGERFACLRKCLEESGR